MRNLTLRLFLYGFCLIAITAYTLIIYLVGQSFWPEKIKGSLILDNNNNIRGSYLLAQHLQDEKYFKARPGSLFGSGCDVAIYNSSFKEILINNYDQRPYNYDISMITSSASAYDPYITRREAELQAARVAKARGIKLEELYKLIDQYTLHKQKPFFKLEIVNSAILNAALDGYHKNF